MTFPLMTIRSAGASGDDLLYPDVGPQSSPRVTALSRQDGNPAAFVATALTVTRISGASQEKVLFVKDVRIDVDVTDSRVLIGCANYDKGGGWWGLGGGGALFAALANGVSKLLAARRSHGKALVGHVRYAWLDQVGAHSSDGFFDAEQVRLCVREGRADGGAQLMLTLTVPKDLDAQAIAQAVIRRAATWRLAHDVSVDEAERVKLEALTQAGRLVNESKKFALHMMPSSFPVTAANSGETVGTPVSQPNEVLS